MHAHEPRVGEDELARVARRVRRHIVRMIAGAGSGHPGGSLSCADILVTLYFRVLRVDPRRPQWPDRDRFVLSKGHACPALYAVLAERGFFPLDELWTLRRLGSSLQGHPDMRKTPGVEASTGSLGQGLSVGLGMALAGRLDGAPWRVYVLLGDGEIQEGQVWEAAMAAAHYGVDNLTAILDWNGLQIDGPNDEVMTVRPVADKWRAFGWEVTEIDGHRFDEILEALRWARSVRGKPAIILARTVKGRGVSFMEGQVDWHGKAPSPAQAEQALAELEGEA
ncbi:MAG: transketolase [Firmicutes bacterium]|nr:transketolase [Bacillota bacterium]MDI6824305.1 transketolase [Bacillota bacterium]MDI7249824.1 transketolase [Bacillota bacterium]